MCGHLTVDVIFAKRRTYKLHITHISGGILPPSGCNSLPPLAQFGRKLRPLPPPPVDAPDQDHSGGTKKDKWPHSKKLHTSGIYY